MMQVVKGIAAFTFEYSLVASTVVLIYHFTVNQVEVSTYYLGNYRFRLTHLVL